MTQALQVVQVQLEPGRDGILKKGDVEVALDAIVPAIESLRELASDADAPQRLGDLAHLRLVLEQVPAPYKRVVLASSHVHNRRRYRQDGWTSADHLAECLKQNRTYFKRRGVATSLDMDNRDAFGDRGVTGTANDRDVFVAFMKKIGLQDAVSPNAVAAAVMKGLRSDAVTRGQSEDIYGKLFDAMARKPGQNVDRPVFDGIIAGTPLQASADTAYGVLCDLTKRRYKAINDAITKAHAMLQVSLTLEKDGIARFALNNPFGLAIPYEGSLFRVYELDEAHHVARVCPTFFTMTGGAGEDDPFELFAISHGTFADLDHLEKFRIGEVYVPATLEQLKRVGQYAVEHCKFDFAVLATDTDKVLGQVIAGSGGMIRKVKD